MGKPNHYTDIGIGDEDYITNALDVHIYECVDISGYDVKENPVATKLYNQWLDDYEKGCDTDCYFAYKMRLHYRQMKEKTL